MAKIFTIFGTAKSDYSITLRVPDSMTKDEVLEYLKGGVENYEVETLNETHDLIDIDNDSLEIEEG